MKIINDADEVVTTFDDGYGVLVVTTEGFDGVMPSGKDDDEVPEHLLALAELMAVAAERGIKGLAEDFMRRSKH